MATVINLPKDTRFGDIGRSAVSALTSFSEARKEKAMAEEFRKGIELLDSVTTRAEAMAIIAGLPDSIPEFWQT